MQPTHSLLSRISRWATGIVVAGAAVLAVIAWGGFEVRDEAVGRPMPRAVRMPALPAEPGSGVIEYVEGYEAGSRRAAAEDRPLLVIFRAGWCRWSAELTQETLSDRRLIDLSRRFVCVIVDADRHAADCRRFGVKQFPTVVLAASSGVEQRRWTGRPTADELVNAMSNGLPTARMATADTEDDATR